MEPRKYEYIDSLRGIAILLVILRHIRVDIEFFPSFLNQLIVDGRLGVQLFYIVSAFTLAISYHSRMNESNKTVNFFIRRFFRIAPLFYLAVIVASIDIVTDTYIYTFRSRLYDDLSILEILTNIFFINGFVPQYINNLVPGGWSIAVEFMFYIFLPFILSKVKDLNTSILFLTISLLFSSMFYFLLNQILVPDTHGFTYFNFINQLPIFALGILAYWVLNDKQIKIKPITLLICTLVAFIYCYISIPYHFLYSIFFVLLLLTLSIKPYKFLANRILANIGKFSFSLYLTHSIFANIFREKEFISATNLQSATLNYIIIYLIVFTCSYLVSQLTYRFIEIPGQNLGGKLIKN